MIKLNENLSKKNQSLPDHNDRADFQEEALKLIITEEPKVEKEVKKAGVELKKEEAPEVPVHVEKQTVEEKPEKEEEENHSHHLTDEENEEGNQGIDIDH